MDADESEFFEKGRKLHASYVEKIESLEKMFAAMGEPLIRKRSVSQVPHTSPTIQNEDARDSDGPKSLSQWVRAAIQGIDGEFTNPSVTERLKEINAEVAARLTSPRMSQELYQLSRNGEIEHIGEKSGGIKTYRVTKTFRPVVKYRRSAEGVAETKGPAS